MSDLIDLPAIRAAHRRIGPFIHRTPVMTSATFDAMTGAALFFKCENLQKVGAFKFRGATNAVRSLTDDQAARGVVTHSSGNHAAALALAARMRGVPAYIVMPRTAPKIKQDAVAGYGGQITLCEPNDASRAAAAAEIQARTGAAMIHPFDNPQVIAGQGTAALELVEDVPDLDMIIAPVGGGGLMSGTAIAAKSLRPGIKVVGCEPSLADDAAQSLREGRIVPARGVPCAGDGLMTALGQITFPILSRLVDQMADATDEQMLSTARLVLERMKILVEPSAAVTLAAVLHGQIPVGGLRVGIIFSGGNVQLERLSARS